ncbi:MAG: FAD-dependent oxidoreductase [Verrucomicrobiota bacterium]
MNTSFPRRHFLQLTGSTLLAAAAPWKNLYGATEDVAQTPRPDGKVAISFLEAADVLICGSTLFACELAIQSAKSGKRTVLVMERVNPFFEGVTCLRTWLETGNSGEVPALLRGVLNNTETSRSKDGRTYYNASKVILDIEDRLSEANVRFYYNAPVAAALGKDGKLCGVVFGGKTGLFGVESPVVVDCTPEATVARAVGAAFTPVEGPRRYRYVADLGAAVPRRSTQYTASNGAKVQVELHHYYACFEITIASQRSGPLVYSEDFESVYEASLDCPYEGAEKRFRGADGFLCSGIDRLDAAQGRVKEFANLFVFGPHGVDGNQEGSLILSDPWVLFRAFPDALAQISASFGAVPLKRPVYEIWNKGVSSDPNPSPGSIHSFQDHGFSEPGAEVSEVYFAPPKAAFGSELIIAGGGTSGNAASYKAGELGFNAVCLERGWELGGTNTIGGVTNLWFGNKTGAFDKYYKKMGAKNDGLNAPAFFKGVKAAGAKILFGAAITGVGHANRQIRRVYIITPFGLTSVEGTHLIDATGDGSLCAWAGCGYTFGGEHDEMTLWGSFAGFLPGKGEALRPFLSPCDERSAADATRFILSMRRNSKVPPKGLHMPPPFYLAPRETRHITCGSQLTFLDTLAGRKFADGIFRVESNPDIKGLATSDAAKAGFIPMDWKALFQVTVPYAALIPRQLDNVIIAGKAYCATHDALSIARMQRDLCVMGMAAVHAMEIAKKRRVLPRNVPIRELQQQLIEQEMLKASDISEDNYGFTDTVQELIEKVVSASDMDKALTPSAQLCVLPREKTIAALNAYTGKMTPSAARLFCFLGVRGGNESYLAKTEEMLSVSPLSSEIYGRNLNGYKHTMPDQGYGADSVLMLGALTVAKETRAIPLLVKLSQVLDVENHDFQTFWGYVYTLACSAERFAASEIVWGLQRLLRAERFKNRIVSRTDDIRKCRDTMSERHAYLQLALSRALIRCGDIEGAKALVPFLNEARVCFARCARAELVAATGKDFGFDAKQWMDWFAVNAGVLKANPFSMVLG